MSGLLLDVLPWTVSGSPRDERLYVLSLAALVLGTLLCVVAVRRPRLDVLAGATAAGGVGSWLLANSRAEGGTLLVVLPGNGLTVADLAALPAVVLTLTLCVRRLTVS